VPPSDDLQFSTVEPAPGSGPAAAPTCAACRQPITDLYYAVGDKLICPACRERYAAAREGGSRVGRLLKATIFGIGAGILGALIWWGVRRATGYEIGLIAIVVGFLVGGAVRAGSGGRGGRAYQLLALVLAYFAIALNYAPEVFTGLRQVYEKQRTTHASTKEPSAASSQPAASADSSDEAPVPHAHGPVSAGKMILAVAVLATLLAAAVLSAPVIVGMHNVIGLLIMGFALWEAWKINARARVPFAGPYSLAQGAGGGPGAGAMP
jgi:hypothetical protein